MRLPYKTLEKELLKKYKSIIAVDEVGMGCLAGPVVVCAVILRRSFFNKNHRKLSHLRDSKLLSAKQRGIFSDELIKTRGLNYRICFCYPRTIDKINIYQASRRAMQRAISMVIMRNLQDDHANKAVILVDGPRKIDGVKLDQFAIVKGDRKVFTIACASIIAKVYRDKMMVRYAKKFPNYGFEKHKGYGTKYHVAQLIALGPTPIHRHSFARLNFWTKDNPEPWRTGPKT